MVLLNADQRILRPGPDGAAIISDRSYPNAFVLRIGRTDQSYVDLDDPRRLEFDYVQRIADGLDVHGVPGERLRIVHVGGAAMTLARYAALTRPQSAQIVLEPDVELTDFVRRHLPLPARSGIKVRATDGRSGVAEMRDGYADVVIVDAFVGAQVPAELTTLEAFHDVRRVLGPTGLMMVNLTDRAPFDYARRVVAGVRDTFAHVAFCAEPSTIKGRRFGNVVLFASPAMLPVDPLAARAARSAFPYRVIHGARLTQLTGGASAFTDADAEMSPPPPQGMTHFA